MGAARSTNAGVFVPGARVILSRRFDPLRSLGQVTLANDSQLTEFRISNFELRMKKKKQRGCRPFILHSSFFIRNSKFSHVERRMTEAPLSCYQSRHAPRPPWPSAARSAVVRH